MALTSGGLLGKDGSLVRHFADDCTWEPVREDRGFADEMWGRGRFKYEAVQTPSKEHQWQVM